MIFYSMRLVKIYNRVIYNRVICFGICFLYTSRSFARLQAKTFNRNLVTGVSWKPFLWMGNIFSTNYPVLWNLQHTYPTPHSHFSNKRVGNFEFEFCKNTEDGFNGVMHALRILLFFILILKDHKFYWHLVGIE